jgi:mercuric ion transport protein
MKDKAFLGASLLAALVASFCCILPIAFASAGMGIAGASAFFAAWRPYLLGLTFAFLGLGLYLSYRKQRDACEPGSACERPVISRSGRIGLWLAAVFVILLAAFPYYSGAVASLLLSDGKAQPPAASHLEHVALTVEGMTCPACAEGVEHKLTRMAGVHKATVFYEQRKAEVEYDPQRVPLIEIKKVFTDAGYRVQTI